MSFSSGFNSWKDICDVIVIPIVAVLFATSFPRCQEETRQETFKRLMTRELYEIEPQPPKKVDGGIWYQHLKKSDFIHQRIIGDPTGNRDFILSLNPDQVYLLSQLWSHTKRAKNGEEGQQYIAKKWISYYGRLCYGHQSENDPCRDTYKQWIELMLSYGIKIEN